MAIATQTVTASGFCFGGFITAAQYNAIAGLSSPSNSAQIQAAINYASNAIRVNLDRLLVTIADGVTIVETTHGPGHYLYVPKEAPVVSVTDIEQWNGTEWDSLDTTTNELWTDGNMIGTRERTAFFDRGFDNWRFTYTIGWPTFPEDFQYAVYLMTRSYLDRASKRTDLSSQSDDNQSFSYFAPNQIGIPEEATDILALYRRERPIYGMNLL